MHVQKYESNMCMLSNQVPCPCNKINSLCMHGQAYVCICVLFVCVFTLYFVQPCKMHIELWEHWNEHMNGHMCSIISSHQRMCIFMLLHLCSYSFTRNKLSHLHIRISYTYMLTSKLDIWTYSCSAYNT